MWWGPVLCSVGCRTAPLDSTYHMPQCDNLKHLVASPQAENHCPEDRFFPSAAPEDFTQEEVKLLCSPLVPRSV